FGSPILTKLLFLLKHSPGFRKGDPLKDAECIAFLQWALPKLGLRWAGFRKVRRQVCRRLGSRLNQLELQSLDEYRARLAGDPEEWAVLDSMCRITISRFYRDKGVFRALSDIVLPAIARRAEEEKREATCWSAGCASGEEVYTLKIIWNALVSPNREKGVTLTVIGTDIDDAVLKRASVGCYQKGTLREMPYMLITDHFESKGDFLCVKEEHRRGVSFVKQDIRTAMPAGPFDLILCRNLVFTYFDLESQRRVLSKLAARLRPDGYLVIGAHESLPDGVSGFTPIPKSRLILQYHPSGADA